MSLFLNQIYIGAIPDSFLNFYETIYYSIYTLLVEIKIEIITNPWQLKGEINHRHLKVPNMKTLPPFSLN